MADVVTGKLDVRPAARHLPAEPLSPNLSPEPRAGGIPRTRGSRRGRVSWAKAPALTILSATKAKP